jgi:hypothetical protein
VTWFMASMCNVRENVSPGAAHREARWKEFRCLCKPVGPEQSGLSRDLPDDVSRSY